MKKSSRLTRIVKNNNKGIRTSTLSPKASEIKRIKYLQASRSRKDVRMNRQEMQPIFRYERNIDKVSKGFKIERDKKSKRILIVGGGVAGLYCAYILSLGHDVIIVEKTSNFGGEMQTLVYEHENGHYYFDIGPHVPPGSFEKSEWCPEWLFICANTDCVNVLTPIKASIKIDDTTIEYPITINSINLKILKTFVPHAISFILAKILERKEKNLEDSSINSWGYTFYNKIIREFIFKFLKEDPRNISTNYRTKISPPEIKRILSSMARIFMRMILRSGKTKSTPSNKNYEYVYPKLGVQGAIDSLVADL
ncbi:MAG: NAD(P)-binding protein, partial [Promethearchaeota archaeon]